MQNGEIIGYELITGSKSTLSKQVNALMNDGWEPLGGVAASVSMNFHGKTIVLLAQAMVKRDRG